MNNLSKKLLIFLVLGAIFLPFLQPQKSNAAGASLYLSPASGSKYVGDRFNIFVYVGASQAVNTFDVYLSSSNLTVIGVSSGGSICVLFPNPPSYTSSTARFRCGLPTPGFNGSKGYIGSVVVRADSVGTGRLSVTGSSSVLANDGAGTNVLNSRGSATFNIQPYPTSAPSVSSSTHPNQDSWYKNTSANLNWSGSGSNFSYTLDQNPDTTPDQVSEGSSTSKTFTGLSEGVWYFHIIVRGSNNLWSNTTHFRIQIDTTPPEPFTPEADPSVNSEKRPIIAFSTTDKTSGISHYEIKLDDGKFEKVDYPYQIPKISSGKHTVFVKAVDKAGNERISSVDFTIKEIEIPKITLPTNGSVIPYGSDLLIKGTSLPNYSVKIYLDGKEIATVKTDKNGNFEYKYKELLRSGSHKLHAVAVNEDQIESKSSEVVNFNLDPKAYIILGKTVPASSIWITFIVIIFLLLIIFVFLLFGAKRFRKKLKSILEELEEEVEKDLVKEKVSKKIRDEIGEEFEEAEEKLEK